MQLGDKISDMHVHVLLINKLSRYTSMLFHCFWIGGPLSLSVNSKPLTLKVPIKTAADDIYK